MRPQTTAEKLAEAEANLTEQRHQLQFASRADDTQAVDAAYKAIRYYRKLIRSLTY